MLSQKLVCTSSEGTRMGRHPRPGLPHLPSHPHPCLGPPLGGPPLAGSPACPHQPPLAQRGHLRMLHWLRAGGLFHPAPSRLPSSREPPAPYLPAWSPARRPRYLSMNLSALSTAAAGPNQALTSLSLRLITHSDKPPDLEELGDSKTFPTEAARVTPRAGGGVSAGQCLVCVQGRRHVC